MKHRILIFATCTFFLLTAEARAERDGWTPLGPEGGAFQELFVVGETIYAQKRDRAGIFVSRDDGASWNRLLYDRRIDGQIDPWELYSAGDVLLTRRNGSYAVSPDSGRSWRPVDVPENSFNIDVAFDQATQTLVRFSLIDPNRPGAQVSVSTDLGATWQARGQLPLQIRPIVTVASMRTNTIIVFYQGNRIFASTDGGWGFEEVGFLPGRLGFSRTQFYTRVDPVDPRIIYVLLEGDGPGFLFRSTDMGRTWTQRARLLPRLGGDFLHLAIDPRNPRRLLATSTASVFESADGGTTWRELDVGIEGRTGGLAAAFGRRPGDRWVSTFDDLARSVDGGATWSLRQQGLRAVDVGAPSIARDGTFYVTGRELHRGTVEGPMLAPMPNQPGPRIGDLTGVAVAPGDSQVVYAGAPHEVYRSNDGGTSWTRTAATTGVGENTIAVRPDDPMQFLTVLGTQIARSQDAGETAEVLVDTTFSSELFGLQLTTIAISSIDPSFVVVGTHTGALIISDNGGDTWSLRPGPDVFTALPSVTEVVLDPFDDTALYVQRFFDVHRSSDGGHTWSEVRVEADGPRVISGLALDPRRRGRVYAAAYNHGAYRSDDGGSTWRPMNAGAPFESLINLRSHADRPQHLVAASPHGVYTFEQIDRCTPGPTVLCLDDEPGDGRFEISLRYETTNGGGRSGDARAIPLASLGVDRGGLFHFGNQANPEVLVKLLDGCGSNDRFWVFGAAATDLGYEMVVRDLLADTRTVYTNADGQSAPTVTDTGAFDTCDLSAPPVSAVALSDSSITEVPTTEVPASPTPLPVASQDACTSDATTLCIDDEPGDGRFRVRMRFDSALGGGVAGDARALSLDTLGVDRGGILHFGNPRNPEVLVKVLDGCAINSHYWVFTAASTNLGFALSVEDTQAGETFEVDNPDGQRAVSVNETRAFETCTR